jgi:hypothetical protein
MHPADSEKKLMLLLTAYMDESGHSADPNTNFAAMAGFVAPFEIFRVAGEIWDKTIKKSPFELKGPFHMKDFAHFEGEFKGWSEDKRKALFRQLIQVITLSELHPVGAVVSIEDFNSLSECQRTSFRDPYYMTFQICTRGAALEALFHEPEKVAMVYAYNQERGTTKPQDTYSVDQAGGAEQLWHAMKDMTDYGRWMGTYSSSTPAEVIQLQMADLFVYELTKDFENLKRRPDDPMRWGLRQILTLADPEFSMIRLLDRREMLRIVKESRFRCQTGTEEVDDVSVQMEFARRGVAEWIKTRVANHNDNERQKRRVQAVQQFDAGAGKDSPQRTKSRTGSGEGGESKKAEG